MAKTRKATKAEESTSINDQLKAFEEESGNPNGKGIMAAIKESEEKESTKEYSVDGASIEREKKELERFNETIAKQKEVGGHEQLNVLVTDGGVMVGIYNASKHELPQYETSGAAGVDLRANLPKAFIRLNPLERRLVPTGVYLELPVGMEAQIRPRSGLAHKKGITVLNSPGTIDSDYRGEVFVNLINMSASEVMIQDGERIAQIVFAKCEQVVFISKELEEFGTTERGVNGHGSTGAA